MAPVRNVFVDGVLNKPCNFCGCQVTPENRVKAKWTKNGYTILAVCKDCYFAQARERNARRYKRLSDGSTAMRQYRLKQLYGMSMVEYTEMLTKQNGVCAVCRKINENGRPLFVDHDHATGRVRQLICFRCNVILGHASDDRDLLIKLADYLTRHEVIHE